MYVAGEIGFEIILLQKRERERACEVTGKLSGDPCPEYEGNTCMRRKECEEGRNGSNRYWKLEARCSMERTEISKLQ